MCVCMRVCMSTITRLCCYRMELWSLSCQHSFVATGLGVLAVPAGSGTITSPPSPPLSLGATIHLFGRHSQKWPEMGITWLYQHPASPKGARADRIRCVMCSVLSHQLWFDNRGENSTRLRADMTRECLHTFHSDPESTSRFGSQPYIWVGHTWFVHTPNLYSDPCKYFGIILESGVWKADPDNMWIGHPPEECQTFGDKWKLNRKGHTSWQRSRTWS